MRKKASALSTLIAALAIVLVWPSALVAQPAPSIEEAVGAIGGTISRKVVSDLALPATSEEYEALGKNGVLMLSARSAMASELPLRSAYIAVGDVRVPLQRIGVLDKQEVRIPVGDRTEQYWEQVSFYLVPITFLRRTSELRVDFTGPRSGFGVVKFDEHALDSAPTFIRADGYDQPAEPDFAAVTTMLLREYPTYFQNAEE